MSATHTDPLGAIATPVRGWKSFHWIDIIAAWTKDSKRDSATVHYKWTTSWINSNSTWLEIDKADYTNEDIDFLVWGQWLFESQNQSHEEDQKCHRGTLRTLKLVVAINDVRESFITMKYLDTIIAMFILPSGPIHTANKCWNNLLTNSFTANSTQKPST